MLHARSDLRYSATRVLNLCESVQSVDSWPFLRFLCLCGLTFFSQPQVIHFDIAHHADLAGESFVLGNSKALQEIPLFAAHF